MKNNSKLISIIGTVFCGSTLVGNFLNQKINALFVGELNRISFKGNDFRINDIKFRDSLQSDSFLNTVNPDRRDSFWSDVLLNADNFSGLLNNISLAICDQKRSYIIEDSKFPDWIDYLVMNNCKPFFQILLFRSPLAWLKSMIKTETKTEFQCRDLLVHKIIDQYITIYQWHIVNSFYYDIPFMPMSFEGFTNLPDLYILSLIDKLNGLSHMSCKFFLSNKSDLNFSVFNDKCHAIGGNAKGYLLIKEFQDAISNSDAASMKEILLRYKSLMPGQLVEILTNHESFHSISNIPMVNIDIDIDILKNEYGLDNVHCKKLKELYIWLDTYEQCVCKPCACESFPEFIKPTLDPLDKKMAKVTGMVIDLCESFSKKTHSLPVFSVSFGDGIDQKLVQLTDSIRECLSGRDIVIGEKSMQINRMHEELLRATAQLELLKEVMKNNVSEDYL